MSLIMLPTMIAPRRWMIACFKVWSQGRHPGPLGSVCNIKVEVRGRAPFWPTGAALVAPKHQCMFDVFAPLAWLPDSCFVMKKELMWIPFIGWFALKQRMIVIDRAGQAAAHKKRRSRDGDGPFH